MDMLLSAYLSILTGLNDTGDATVPRQYQTVAVAEERNRYDGPHTCNTALGRHYREGQVLDMEGFKLECKLMTSWEGGEYSGTAMRWTPLKTATR